MRHFMNKEQAESNLQIAKVRMGETYTYNVESVKTLTQGTLYAIACYDMTGNFLGYY